MKKGKKIITLILVLVILAALSTACGGNNSTTSPSDSPSSSASASANTSSSSSPSASASASASAPAIVATPPPSSEGGKEVKYAEEFTYITESGVATLNVHSPAGHGPGNTHSYRMISDTLLYTEMDGSVSYMLATGYETEDYKSWIFHLRDDVYFHNGDHFTAKDVVFTWSAALDKLGSPAIDNWAYVKEMNIIDDYTVEMILDTPYIDFYRHMTPAQAIILNERAITEDPEKGYWCGTGAYKVVDFVSGDYVVYERNDDYWGGQPYTKRIKMWYVPEASSRTIMLQTGEAQVCMSLPMNDFAIFETSPDFSVMSITQQNPVIVCFNLDDPLCSDINFRKAVAYAMDPEELAILARGDMYELQTDGATWGLQTPYRKTDLPAFRQDLDLAKQYLQQSRYDGSPVEYTVGSGGEALQAQLAAIGIDLVLNQMDMASFSAYTAYGSNKAQMIGTALLISTTPGAGYRMNFNPGMGNNKYQYNNQYFTDLLAVAMNTPDGDERRDMFYELQDIIYDEVPCVPQYYVVSKIVSVNGFGGLKVTSGMAMDLRFTYLILDD